MRLTGGADRGRQIVAPRGLTTRPTSSKVREAIFNILGPPPQGAVLDLFAGSGALGFEALSRGAERAVFVERDGRAVGALTRNLRELGFAQRSQVISSPVMVALSRLSATPERFVWVFMDPPYAAGVTEETLARLGEGSLLCGGSVVIVEHDHRHEPPDARGGLHLTDRRYYGDTGVSFYRRDAGVA